MNVIIERNHLHLKPCIVIFFSCKPAKLVILCGWFVCGWDGYFKCAVRTYRKPVHSYGTVLNVQGQYYRQFLDEYCHGTEEQERKILLGHMLIWTKNFNKLRDLHYHLDESIRKKALQELQKYVEKIFSSYYGDVVIWAFSL